MFLLGSRGGLIATALIVTVTATAVVIQATNGVLPEHYTTGFFIRFVPSFFVVSAFAYAFVRLRERDEREIVASNTGLQSVVGDLRGQETALETARGELEQRVLARTADLQQANVALVREVSERRKAEAEIAASRDRFTTVLDGIDANVYVIDLETDEILFMNRSMRELWGEELVGRICWAALKEGGERCPDCTPGAGEGEPRVRVWEERCPVTGRWFLYQLRVVDWVDGRPVRICVATDIAVRKTAEGENLRLQGELARAQRMEAIGTLAGGVAHDLNNVLAGIVSYPDLILRQLPDDSPVRGSIETIMRSGEKCAAIVQDLLALARRGVQVTETIDLNVVVRDYLASPEHQRLGACHPAVAVETGLADDLLPIRGSAVHLGKCVMNLVRNGAEAMAAGGELAIATRNRHVEREEPPHPVLGEGDYAVLTVTDRGVGISEEDLDHIFEPFYTKKKMGGSGTGLGMSVVWGTVLDHSGHIDVESRPGEGTRVEIHLPAVRDATRPAQEAKPDTDESAFRGHGESILVVDDVPEQREIAERVLTRLGYEVETARSGEEALDRLRARGFDLLVLDMIMDPGIDGLETYGRARAIHPAQRAILVSGFSETDRVREAQRLGAGAYVKKPYLIHELGRAVQAELSGEAARLR